MENNVFLIGEFIFILNPYWTAQKQLDVGHFYKRRQYIIKEIISTIVGVNIPVLL